jgi:hypothetical protein
MEVWKPVPGWEGYYDVSDHGRVRSHYHKGKPRVRPWIKKPVVQRRGYHQIAFVSGERYERTTIHRLVLKAFIGPCPDHMEGCHLDGNPSNNRLDNLKWGTKAENMAHRDDHGRTVKGEKQWEALFTEAEVKDMRARYASGEKLSKLVNSLVAEKGCDPSTVRKIIARQLWKHVH